MNFSSCRPNKNRNFSLNYFSSFVTFQSDGFWVDRKSNRKVKLPDVHFHELCPRELETLANIAIDRINNHPDIPDVKMKLKTKPLHTKIARKLSSLRNANQNDDKEFVSLFGIKRVRKKESKNQFYNIFETLS